MAIVCDDYLVPAMERLCEHLDIPEEVRINFAPNYQILMSV